MAFDYLLDRIRDAEFLEVPFRHVEIHELFRPEHLAEILAAPEISPPRQACDADLFEALFARGYKIVDFPGCSTDRDAYMRWHVEKPVVHHESSACSGFGVTLRLVKPRSATLRELVDFLAGRSFQEGLAEKFQLDLGVVVHDAGIQKYLDGYEISPHPDIRRKALTYMVNVNPGPDSEGRDHHTAYLRFRDDYRYVEDYWRAHPDQDRCWVPWDWCYTVKSQRANNSMVAFVPDDTTLHAVRANYDHLGQQRTQLYGNFWLRESPAGPGPQWEDFVHGRTGIRYRPPVVSRIASLLPGGLRESLAGWRRRTRSIDPHVIADRMSHK